MIYDNSVTRKKSKCLICNFSKEKTIEIVNILMTRSSKLQSYGYNTTTDEYIGKKIKKCVSSFIFKLKIKQNSLDSTIILIELILGSISDFYEIIKVITNYIILYESTQFNKIYACS